MIFPISYQHNPKTPWQVTMFILAGMVVLVFGGNMLVAKWVYGWAIPELFPGAIEQGIIPALLTWGQTFKLIVLIYLLGLGSYSSSSSSK